ncbi:filamentous hemagglutinin N-terminal domain-containing protein, partial [Stutzerimonas stutzeri]
MSRKKKGTQSVIKAISVSVIGAGSSVALAGPTGGVAVEGGIAIGAMNNNQMVITQALQKGIINWTDFSIDAGELVQFVQNAGNDSVTLNRVLGSQVSNIQGALQANGNIFLINPNGIVFGAGSTIDVAGLLATTFDVDDQSFLNGGDLNFSQVDGAALASISNQGTITADSGGFVYLVAPNVDNSGHVIANVGTVTMAAGNRFTVNLQGSNLINFSVSADALTAATGDALTGVNNSGTVQAQTVLLQGNSASGLMSSVVNNSGIVEATDLTMTGGDIVQNGTIKGVGVAAATTATLAATQTITTGSNSSTRASTLNLSVTGEGASIGTEEEALKVDADVLSATAENGHVLVTDVSGGVALLDVRAGTAQAGGSVVITAKGGSITSAHPSHTNVTGYSANFIADGSVGTTNDAVGAQVGVLSASTQDGGINLNNEGSVILGDIVAREQITVGGQTVSSTAVDNAGSIKLSNGDAGTKSVSVRSTGDVILTGTVSATDALSVRSNTGSILAAQAGTQLVGRTINLQAGKEVGDVSQALSTQSNTVNAISQDGGIYLNESNGLTVGTINASGNDNDVVLNATAGNIAVGSITADGGSVSLTAAAGGITDNNGDATNATAADLSLSSKNAIGTSGNALETNVDTLSATTSAAQAGVFLSNLKALTKLSVTTPNGDTNVAFSGGALIYNRNLSTLSLARTLGLDVAFSNIASGYKLGGIDAGADKSVSLYAAGDITQGSGRVVAKDLSIEASGNIGSADTALQTATDTLSLSTRNGFANLANTSDELALSATANAANGAVKLSQTGDLVVDSVNATTGVELNADGAITAAEDSVGTNISAGSLKLSGASIGTASQALTSQVNGGAVNLTANSGDVNFSNIGAISLLDVLASGKVSFQNSGDAVVGQVQAGGTVNFKVSGNVTDGNGDGANFVTSGLTAAVRSFGTSGDALEIQVDSLVIDAANGGIYARQSNGNLLSLVQLTSGGSGSDIQVSASGDIALGHVDAGGNNVKLSAAGSIEDARSDKSKANIVARSLDMSAPGGIGQQGGLDLDVSFLAAAGGSGGVTATNAGAVAVDSSSLVGKGASAITIVATAITVLDNSGGTITMDGGTLTLTATAGNIVFLNQNDTIYLPGGGSITLTALSKSDSAVPGYDGVIIAGNLKTDGGKITLQAQSNITIGMLDAQGNAGTAGDVTVASAGGVILDGNGTAQNIRGNKVSLTASTPSEHDAELTRDTAIAEYSARDAEAAAKLLQLNILIQQLKDYEALVTSAALQNSLAELSQRLAEIAANNQSSKVDSMSAVADGLNTALNAATVVRNAAAVIAGAAQAIPFSGDAGADAAFAVVDLVMSAASLALDSYERYSLAPEQDLLTELNNTLDVANAAIYTAATNLATTTAIRDTTATSKAAADLAVFKANTARDASLQVRRQAVAAYDLNQQIDSSADKPLGITANRLDINGGDTIDSSLYLDSTGSLGLGDITVASGEQIVAEAADDIGVVGSVNSDTSISLTAGNAILGQGGTLITPDLLMVAGNGIGANQAVNTQTDRVAADAGNSGVAITNANGGALLTIGTQGAVKGITGAGDINVITDGSLKIDELVKDSTHTHTVSLTSTNGAIVDGNTVERNVQGGTLVAKAAGSIDLDTEVDTLNAEVTDAGNITLREANGVTARDLKTADGDIDLNAAGAVVVGSLDAGSGTGRIDLTAGGAVDDDQDNSTLIVADALSINATGSVGATGSNTNRHLDTQVNSVDVTASGEVNLAEVDNLNVGILETDHGDVTVTTGGSLNLGTLTTDTVDSTVTLVAGGQISNAKDDESSNIDAANLALSAANGIGADKALNVNVANLEAHADTGSIKVEDLDGDLVIGGVTPNLGNAAITGVNTNGGDIQIGTAGNLTVNETVINTDSGAITLSAGGNVQQNVDLQTVNGGISVAAGGDIDMLAGTRALSQGTGDISYTADGNASLQQITTNSGNIDLGAGGNLIQHALVQTGAGNIKAQAGGDLTTLANTTVTGTGDVNYSAGGNASLQRITTNSGNIDLGADGSLTQHALVQTGAGNIKAQAGGNLTTLADTTVVGSGNVNYLSNEGNVSLQQVTTGAGNVVLEATLGDLTQHALVQTGEGNVNATAGGNLLMTAGQQTQVVGTGDIAYTATGNADLENLSTGSGDIALTAETGDLTQNGLVHSGEGDITTTAGG